MRCPKCGFNSFDHNLTCPKCHKDLTATRRLLNLSIPSPGGINFFRTASERAVYPEPVLEAELELMPEPADLLEAEVSPETIALAEAEITPEPVDLMKPEPDLQPLPVAEPIQEVEIDADDIEPADEFEDIEPEDDDEDIAPLDAAPDDEDEDIVPLDAATDDEDEDITPLDAASDNEIDDIFPEDDEPEDITPLADEGGFSAHLAAAQAAAQAEDLPIVDEEIEIELDDIEALEPESETGEFMPEAVTSPPTGAEAALTQIKNALESTGDLESSVDLEDIEAEPEMEVIIEPEAEAEVVLEAMDPDLDEDELLPEADIQEAEEISAEAYVIGGQEEAEAPAVDVEVIEVGPEEEPDAEEADIIDVEAMPEPAPMAESAAVPQGAGLPPAAEPLAETVEAPTPQTRHLTAEETHPVSPPPSSDSDFDDLSNLVDDLNLDDLDKKI
ncbi:hypothetical protein C4J81_07435 [Deltaproteobacteria bacterium Smac51]|nr:hypothetical protein C4J81_07435 [Deltaproteobacteria bacterium Smac51]